MAAKTQAILILLLISAVLIASPAAGLGGSGAVGGRTEIPDVESNEEIQQLGEYSVEQYNQQHHNGDGGDSTDSAGDLKFVKVVAAEKQVVAGIKYYLKIVAAKGGHKKKFDAEIVVQAWKKTKQLMSFAPSHN
ncbi:hypothetical protein DCAR_0313408 [Daucus carota subsp. sativus]|uniref:Uncharacterized protein n=2 Tax=Daucus carota TaxID=4039 RepID=A0A166C0A4_DAUCS|nr:PREDICTED: cysteine proteinase inhibitor B [Daucus carota subsp. sativus]WOG94115.1 hypothetical protein DCAR_0313408 [Daucus carota subsp. sativus]BAA20464.1 extracellular insoluble cystatin [Daucus carota]